MKRALLSCVPNQENSKYGKTRYGGSRIYVGLSSYVFSMGFPEPGTRTWDTQAHVLYAVTERQSATQKIFAKDNACLRRSHYPATMHLQAWIVFLIYNLETK